MRRCGLNIFFTVFLCALSNAAQTSEVSRIPLGKHELAPIGLTKFCLRKPLRCAKTHDMKLISFEEARSEIERINHEINSSIIPRADPPDEPPWNDAATAGDCEDYAMTKRSRLLDLGYPSSALLLAVLSIPTQELHAVLIVESDQGDFVLDNLEDQIVRWEKLPYRWIKISTPADPQIWRKIQQRQELCNQDSNDADYSVTRAGDRHRKCVAKDGNLSKRAQAKLQSRVNHPR
ncbi:transglutaminase-like cysteine peptidase [Bradyrhizobium sp. MOS002]|uniref:transglutaminase-like cysteine peptidase n=1 Tax=Bradyrhizobium sp. MOS002 TaxID=2133947 RepID=UPI000D12ED01|nr:transglutaminase-like cysteine peptidase [Bradyrhizobium sp. MOS002]PSO17614.1 hypothetical protein C7G41_36040 [Bradyrhizobium sp. MOS002]